MLKIRVQTHPVQQLNVTREFRLRLNQAFKDADIKIAISQQEVQVSNTLEKSHFTNATGNWHKMTRSILILNER